MAQAYHSFAAEHHNLWRELFDLDRPTGEAAPEWYVTELSKLFSCNHDPLMAIFPAMDQNQRLFLTKGLFSSVHGIVLLGLDETNAGVQTDNIDTMIALILRHMARPS